MFKCLYSASGAWFSLIISTCWLPVAPIVGSFCLGLGWPFSLHLLLSHRFVKIDALQNGLLVEMDK